MIEGTQNVGYVYNQLKTVFTNLEPYYFDYEDPIVVWKNVHKSVHLCLCTPNTHTRCINSIPLC